jgi:diguanylate cyclase (GGDEF)-like protein/PAS domain S-box-containing protein
MKPPSPQLPARLGLHLMGALVLYLCLAAPSGAQPREVRVGVYANEPKILLGSDGRISGIFGELLEEISRNENWRLQPVPCDWQRCLELVQSGEIDLMPDVAFSEARAQIFDFHSKPALYSWSLLYSRQRVLLTSPLDLQNQRITVLAGSIQQDFLAAIFAGVKVSGNLMPVASLKQGFKMVSEGQADAAVANQQFGDMHAPLYGLRGTPLMIPPVRMFYATHKGSNDDLLTAIDQHLLAWEDNPDSFYFQALGRWSGPSAAPSIPNTVWWGLAGLATLLLLALGGTLLLRRQVAEKTRHLKASEQRLNTILDSVEAYIYIKDPELRYQYANRKVCEFFGQPLEQVVGQTDERFFDATTAANLHGNDRRVLQLGERLETEETNRSLDGSSEHTFLSVKLPLRNPQGGIYALCGISTDITENKRNLEQINRLAFYDPLTGLPNRRLLFDRLQHALAQSARNQLEGALLFIDLDNFKDLNDTLGHDMGDQLLVQVARRLSSHVRAEDTLARLGGDEFVLMLEGLHPEHEGCIQQIETVANKILQALAAPYSLQGHSYTSTASVGVALFSETHNTVDEVLKRADLAMYQAKSAGRNTLKFFDPVMQAEVSARASLESDLRQSISAGHFILHYQPQVNHEGQLLGAEALIRWQHPSRGLVAPAEFIPLAESTGLILPLGRWVLYSACQQLAAWAEQPKLAGLTLAINVSARQFHHRDFVDDVLAALKEAGANPARLELELTESQLVEDVEAMIVKLTQLRSRGVRFSLDDFGTGYSSLSYLKRLPLDHLKIDRSFVRDLLSDPNDATIVRAIVALGGSLDLEVIAEGVESPEQHAALLQLGCHKFQGYLFGAPGPVAALEQWPPAAILAGELLPSTHSAD